MASTQVAPLLIGILIGLLLGVLGWGFWQFQLPQIQGAMIERHSDLFLSLLMLAAFAFGVFLAYFMLSLS